MSLSTNHFDKSATQWDSPEKIQKSQDTAAKIKSTLYKINPEFKITHTLEVGCGTGLLGGNFISPDTAYTGIDSSSEMLKVLQSKFPMSNVKTLNLDVERESLNHIDYNFVLSQMAFHHLKDPSQVVKSLKKNKDFKLVIIDLDKEDGSFHPDPKSMGVHHFGFTRDEIASWAQGANLNLEHYEIINTIEKNNKQYHQFLAIIG
ncbi:MAG: class I SAM-dependent methyltransferase [Bdellovibrionia bacterium]